MRPLYGPQLSFESFALKPGEPFQDSPMHKALFWVAMAVLQLDEVNLYSAGTALLEQNLHTLDNLRVFNDKVSKPPAGVCIRFLVVLSGLSSIMELKATTGHTPLWCSG